MIFFFSVSTGFGPGLAILFILNVNVNIHLRRELKTSPYCTLWRYFEGTVSWGKMYLSINIICVSDVVYTGAEFFKVLKQRWSTNFDSLEKNYVKMKIRYNETGEYLKKFEHYPTYYK